METMDHLFQLCASSRQRAIREIFSTFHDKFRETKTLKLLISALKAGATAWVEGTAIPDVESLDLPGTVLGQLIAAAYTDQTLLGWNVLFRGFWAKNWRLAQEEQFRLYHSRERQDTDDCWSGRAQMWFIALFESLWGLRNEDEHGVDFETQHLV